MITPYHSVNCFLYMTLKQPDNFLLTCIFLSSKINKAIYSQNSKYEIHHQWISLNDCTFCWSIHACISIQCKYDFYKESGSWLIGIY